MARRRRAQLKIPIKRRTWRKIPGPLQVVIVVALVLLKVILTAWKLGGWISTNFVLRDRKLRWIAKSPRFYWLPQWQAIKLARLLANRAANQNRLTCEHCGTKTAAKYHCDHVYPRSTHPEDALDYDKTQMLCERCNLSKGNRWVGRGKHWERNPRLPMAA